MSPARPTREESIDATTEYDEFIEKVQKFCDERGVPFDPAPKVNQRRVDLLRLYKRVLEEGGYDVVSDKQSKKYMWRQLGQEFQLDRAQNIATVAFQLKTAYYKNLAAFEIADFHKKEPPPREILEDVTAKGAGILTRTLENFERPFSRDEKQLANGLGHDGGDEDGRKTPDSMDIDDPGSGAGRRGLRQAPPQRVLFQADTSLGRTRLQAGHSPGPNPNPYANANGTSVPPNAAQALANYEPRLPVPMTLKPVTTPANKPDEFKTTALALREAALARWVKPTGLPKSVVPPGYGSTGPNFLVRLLRSFQSGILEEQEYAMNNLVRLSFDKPERLRLDQNPGLAEMLLENLLEVTTLFFGVKWIMSFGADQETRNYFNIDAIHGNRMVLDRIRHMPKVSPDSKLHPTEFARRVSLVNEIGLVVRNLTLIDENALHLVKIPATRDMVILLLNLPRQELSAEIRHYGLELAEQIAKYYLTDGDDPFLQSLLRSIDPADKATIVTSFRAISRLATHYDNVAPMPQLPIDIIIKATDWLLVEDQDLQGACLDFLYRFTSIPDNVELLMKIINPEPLVRQLVRLLLHNSHRITRQDFAPPPPLAKPPTPYDLPIPRIPPDLVEQLLGFDEPERSSQWLRACFEEDAAGEITQIALWQAYQIPFSAYAASRPLLPAKDFITNVSSTFSQASAQVMAGATPRFVIKGIKARDVPVDTRSRAYMRCQWRSRGTDGDALLASGEGERCTEFALDGKGMWEHIVQRHLGVTKNTEGKWDFSSPVKKEDDKDMPRTYTCGWAGCRHFAGAGGVTPYAVGMHVKTHLPDASELWYLRSKHNVPEERHAAEAGAGAGPPSRTWVQHTTLSDERYEPVGLPLMAALLLKNLARNIPKTNAGKPAAGGGAEDAVAALARLFAPVREQIFFVLAHNPGLREQLSMLVTALNRGGV